MAEYIRREDSGKVRILSLDRPPSNNLSLALLEGLRVELRSADADASIRCLVLASALPKYFSAGLDLDEMLSLPPPSRARFFHSLIETHRLLAAMGKPTVAAIEGYALLGGFILTLGCDWRLINQDGGKVALSEIRVGLSPTTPLIRLVCSLGGGSRTKELVLQGKTLRACEALEAGLVDQALPGQGFSEAVLREAERLTKLAPLAYAAVKRSLRSVQLGDEETLWREGMREFEELFAGPEAQEGLRARLEKRKPRWE